MTTIRLGVLPTELSRSLSSSIARALGAKGGAEVSLVELAEGLTVSEQRAAVLSTECDAIAIALGDGVAEAPQGIALAAVQKRGDGRDVLCAREADSIDGLAAEATVAVSTPLRVAQLGRRRADLRAKILPGGSVALLAALDAGDVDAIILPAQDLALLDRSADAVESFSLDGWPTAAGQGAIALETRSTDTALVAALDHRPSRVLVEAERTVAELLAPSVSAPLAAHAMIDDGLLFLSARLYSADGSETLTSSHALYVADSPDPARDVATRAAEELLSLGAATIGSDAPGETEPGVSA